LSIGVNVVSFYLHVEFKAQNTKENREHC
jgi:hypothetical protein